MNSLARGRRPNRSSAIALTIIPHSHNHNQQQLFNISVKEAAAAVAVIRVHILKRIKVIRPLQVSSFITTSQSSSSTILVNKQSPCCSQAKSTDRLYLSHTLRRRCRSYSFFLHFTPSNHMSINHSSKKNSTAMLSSLMVSRISVNSGCHQQLSK